MTSFEHDPPAANVQRVSETIVSPEAASKKVVKLRQVPTTLVAPVPPPPAPPPATTDSVRVRPQEPVRAAKPRGRSHAANVARTTAPATPPAVPSAVIPPDAPRVTCAPVVISRGANGEKAPSSVAQVSAA